MKLAASLFCAVAVALAGCGDVETNGGGQGEGILPGKIPFDPDGSKQFDPNDVTMLQQRLGRAPADVICEGCVLDSYSVVDQNMFITEVRVVSDGGTPICRIYLNQDQVVLDECGVGTP